ncbi:tyrosine-type recombinase/integrase [Mucilaginibacter endophyticus]|uniref:tyrosine-type recombinase/integrase n=1 Tax=Mucilaginibacter endophyticus TaxID=2675003 RepID=UPI000E0D4B30|nr:tyrosine-type recombinase/integrase [Mucilaginibacter endophyticus]
MNRFFFSVYGKYIERYICHKRNLGFKYRDIEYTFYLFDKLAFQRGETEVGISKEIAEEWGKSRPGEAPKTRTERVSLLNGFSVYLRTTENKESYVMPVPKFVSTYTPYIFSKKQIASIFEICDSLNVSNGRPDSAMYAAPALFRLLYGTGIRVGEALNLHTDDVNLESNHLTLRSCKNGKDRLIPISASLTRICKEYLNFRGTLAIEDASPFFFVKPTGQPCSKDQAYAWFRTVIYKAGIPHGGKRLGPRLHDFRHTFSVHSLASMAEAGVDLYYSLPILSQYLGHDKIESTDKYVRLTAEMYPDLIAGANKLSPYLFPDLLNQPNDETD